MNCLWRLTALNRLKILEISQVTNRSKVETLLKKFSTETAGNAERREIQISLFESDAQWQHMVFHTKQSNRSNVRRELLSHCWPNSLIVVIYGKIKSLKGCICDQWRYTHTELSVEKTNRMGTHLLLNSPGNESRTFIRTICWADSYRLLFYGRSFECAMENRIIYVWI